MKYFLTNILFFMAAMLIISCGKSGVKENTQNEKTAEEILGNPEYQAICFGAYREKSREIQPTLAEIKEDVKILSAMGIKLLRTYNVYLDEASNLLKAISELKKENSDFEMYVMLGAWIDCKNARTDSVDHSQESGRNAEEIERAVNRAKAYPDIVKIIAVGNEAMVKWATTYYVQPAIILKWVNHLQQLKKEGILPKTLWITSSDNFASWGGGGEEYHVEDLTLLMKAVDFISLHTYPMHDTWYNPEFWGIRENETKLSDLQKIDSSMLRARNYAIAQYQNVIDYMKSLQIEKPVHIGETGWATLSNEYYGDSGTRATDEYKSAIYYDYIREWSNKNKITCFYFEAFDEPWKDAENPDGSENHFGLFNLQSQAKYALWSMVDSGIFEGLSRNGLPLTKTFNGNKKELLKTVKIPPTDKEITEIKSQF